MKADLDRMLARLVGKSMWIARRAADMATFQFGERRQRQTHDGRTAEVGEFALHVQCAWRILRGDKVVVGSRDLYSPANHDDSQPNPETFDWDRDPNRRDALLHDLFDGGTRAYVVTAAQTGRAGTCGIDFDQGMRLELFPDDSSAGEHWRLFEIGGAHVVVSVNEISTDS